MARRTVVVRRPARGRRSSSMLWVVVLAVLVIGGIILWATMNDGGNDVPAVEGLITSLAALR